MHVSSAAGQTASYAWLSIGGTSHQTDVFVPSNTRPVASGVSTTAGLSGGVFLERLYIGGSADVQLPATTGVQAATVRRTGGSGRLDAGVLLLGRSRFLIYPTAGVGIGGTQIRVTHNGSTTLHRIHGVATFRVNGDLIGHNGSAGGPVVGVSVGLRRAFREGNWRTRSDHRMPDVDPIRESRTAVVMTLRAGWGVGRSRR